VLLPPEGDDWVAVSSLPLPVEQLSTWPVRPGCGAVVVFAGTVRDHSAGRPQVSALEYEAYVRGAEGVMWDVVTDLRRHWPELGRIALLHRTGRLALTDVAVVTAVSAPHRREAFAAAELAIDTIKAEAPIWKHETWAGGSDWGLADEARPGDLLGLGAAGAPGPVGP